MKILIFVLISISCHGQFRKDLPSLATTLFAGLAEGQAETLKFHYDQFDRKFKAYDPYWDPNISWKNKYLNNDPSQGPKFPGSTTIFVWTTDGYHMTRMVRNASFVASIVIHPAKKKKWYYYLVDAALHLVVYQIGFNTTYYLVYK